MWFLVFRLKSKIIHQPRIFLALKEKRLLVVLLRLLFPRRDIKNCCSPNSAVHWIFPYVEVVLGLPIDGLCNIFDCNFATKWHYAVHAATIFHITSINMIVFWIYVFVVQCGYADISLSLSLSLSRLHIFLLPPLYPSLSPSFSSFSFWLCVLCLISLVYFVDFYSNRICNKYIENYVLLYEHTTIPLDKPHTLNANG